MIFEDQNKNYKKFLGSKFNVGKNIKGDNYISTLNLENKCNLVLPIFKYNYLNEILKVNE